MALDKDGKIQLHYEKCYRVLQPGQGWSVAEMKTKPQLEVWLKRNQK